MNVGDLPPDLFAAKLRAEGLAIEIPPVVTCIRTALPSVVRGLALFYAGYRIIDDGFSDFHIVIARPSSVRRWFRPQVDFLFDGTRPFKPLPADQAYPVFEWGLNWCIANHCHQYLMLHAAVVERAGRALLMPAPPGSGKSTLTAALVIRGWRLLSDELALITPATLGLTPVPRPISLKNESIDLIRGFAQSAVIGPVSYDTRKGNVAHLKPPAESVRRARAAARPARIVFPRYVAGSPARLERISKARTLVKLTENAFNFASLGDAGFDCLARIVDASDCHEFTYSDLDDAIAVFDSLESPGA